MVAANEQRNDSEAAITGRAFPLSGLNAVFGPKNLMPATERLISRSDAAGP
jgi:hypothetical protein